MKNLLLFLLPLLALTFSACDDTPDYPDTKLIKGQWQLVEDGSNDNPLIYRFTISSSKTCMTSFGM